MSYIICPLQRDDVAAAEGGSDGRTTGGGAKRDSDSDESVDLEVESNASETTVRTRC